tara:strand:- start:478 stop:900 length:423 start_codon:yes stop_codon:yes gene_type:complete
MIKYKLICKDCNLSFDSWFSSSNEYEKLKRKNFLNCHHCDSKKIEKTIMAPKIINKEEKINLEKIRSNQINKKLKEYQNFIKDNFDYVGDNFAYEARSIHYDKKRKEKGIYGTASNDEIKELKDEGIETEVIPWVENKNN